MQTLAKQHSHVAERFAGLRAPGAALDSKVFEDCHFKECDFAGSSFSACKFVDCTFLDCNLSMVRVEYARFANVDFDGCKLLGVNWALANWPRVMRLSPLKFHRCILNDSSFFGLRFEELVIESSKAHDVDFRGGNFSRGVFSYTDLTHSLFGRTSLQGADFTGATNYHIDILDNDVKHAKFSRSEAVNLLDGLGIDWVD